MALNKFQDNNIEKGKPWHMQNRMYGEGRGFSGRKEKIKHYKLKGFLDWLEERHDMKLSIAGEMLTRGKSNDIKLVAEPTEKNFSKVRSSVHEMLGYLRHVQRSLYNQEKPTTEISIKMKPEWKNDVKILFENEYPDIDVNKIKYIKMKRSGLFDHFDGFEYDEIPHERIDQ